MKVCNLSSGSDGNLTYIESNGTRILVDIGLSCKETESRLGQLGVTGREINAILITHEHSDHIKGLEVFANRYRTPVFVHENGLRALLAKIKKPINIVTFGDADFRVNHLTITSVAVPHDVERCSGYFIKENDKKISIVTDLGHTTDEIMNNMLGSDLVFLEANHDPNLLNANPRYPIYLKRRIAGQNGHLSNLDCAECIVKLVESGTKQVVLAHLSTENNSPAFAFEYITAYLRDFGIIEGQHLRIDVATTRPRAIFNV